MNAKRFNRLMIALLALVILGGGVMLYFGNHFMQKSANQLIATKLDNIGYDTEEQTYLQARKDLEKYHDLSEVIQKILPKSKDQAQAVSELYKIGDETGIIIDKIQFPNSTLGQKTTTPTSTNNQNSSATNSPSVTQALPVTGMPGVLGMDIAISLQPGSGKTISYANMIKFLQKVEVNRRNMQIKQIAVQTDTKNGGVTFQMTLTIFVKP
jgi:hypothetical protein